MGNKIATVSGSQNLRPTGRPTSLQRRPTQRDGGSSESLCTFFSLDSHSEQCLLKEQDTNSKNKPLRAKNEPRTACGRTSPFRDDDDGTSTIITTLEDIISNDVEREKENSAVDDQNNEMGNLKIPENLLQKLTTEDWNDLVQFICSSMEQSLQSNILKEIERLREKNLQSSSNDSNEANIDTDHKREEKPVSPLNTVVTSPTVRTSHRRSRHRPLSMPSVSSSQLINNETKHRNASDKYNHQRNNSRSPPLVNDRITNELHVINSKTKVRSSSNPHKVHFTDETRFMSTGVWRSCSGSSLDELDLNSKHKYLKKGYHNSRGYLTLDQLKALGLSLQQDSTKLTSERLSSFSMKCWHGDIHNNHGKSIATSGSTATTGQKRLTKRRHRKRSTKHKHNDIHVRSPDSQKPQLEQLCLLGPNDTVISSSSPSIPSSSTPIPPLPTTFPNDSNEPNKQLSDQDGDQTSGDNNSGTSSSDDSMVTTVPADVKVEHLHQHNHHHYHHFIHHSISQPSGLCDNNNDKTTTTVQYALSTNFMKEDKIVD